MIIDASSDPDVGELDINCGNLNFGAATLVVGIMGSYSGYSDLLKVNGNMLIDTKLSTLSVDVSGTAQLNSSWTIIKANNQLNQFPNTNDQQTGLHDGPDPLNPKQYLVTK